MFDETMIDLSRWQFAITAMYHFLFVPLTLGMSWMLVIMESVYIMTGAAQPGGPGEVCAHGRRQLCDRRHVRGGHQ